MIINRVYTERKLSYCNKCFIWMLGTTISIGLYLAFDITFNEEPTLFIGCSLALAGLSVATIVIGWTIYTTLNDLKDSPSPQANSSDGGKAPSASDGAGVNSAQTENSLKTDVHIVLESKVDANGKAETSADISLDSRGNVIIIAPSKADKVTVNQGYSATTGAETAQEKGQTKPENQNSDQS